MPGERIEPRWSDNAPPAEKALYAAVRDALPGHVAVIPQVMMTVDGRGRPEEAEADLVIVDPSHGVLIVEVKGGTLSYDPTRAVWRRREGNGRIVRDPVQQAKKARSIVRNLLKQHHFPTDEIPLRWAVAVPDCTLDTPGEAILPGRQLWDASALPAIGEMVRATQGELVLGEAAIGDVRAEAIVRALRGRAVEGTPSGLAEVTEHEARIRALTESHRNVLHTFLAHRRVLVRGAAGTGKTMLAIEAAARFAAQGERVLLTCWHRLLATALRARLAERLAAAGSPVQVSADPSGQVVVTDLASLAGSSGPPEGADPREWYYEVLPDRLGPEVTGGLFDVIVLDEAQDPTELWLLALAGLQRDGGRWYAFADRQQDLFGNAPGLADFLDVDHQLRENFRNSRQIVEVVTWFGDVETDCLTGDGPPVRFIRVPEDRVVGRTAEIARKLVRDEGFRPSQVAAIWLYHNPFQGDPDGLITQDRDGEVVTTNSAAFKGMEREVVVLGLDLREGRTREDNRRAIYTAASRARSQLVVVADPDQLRREELYILAGRFKDSSAEP